MLRVVRKAKVPLTPATVAAMEAHLAPTPAACMVPCRGSPRWRVCGRVSGRRGAGGHVRIGYARTSTARQSLDTQTDALRAAGVTRVFTEKISTRAVIRPELDKAVALAGEIRASGAAIRARFRIPLADLAEHAPISACTSSAVRTSAGYVRPCSAAPGRAA